MTTHRPAHKPSQKPIGYQDSGVSIEAGHALVKAIVPLAQATACPGSSPALGGFAGSFDPKAAGFQDPVLVAATDGVGTKAMLAHELGLIEGLGIDLVAMCVNDLIVSGAKPLFFLDYFACSRLEQAQATALMASIAEGCRRAGCALIGGETAEMPGLYQHGHFDLAGFAVGAMERARFEDPRHPEPGDLVIALPSSGPHANGFSLIRKIIAGVDLSRPAPFERSVTLAEALLRPTQIYVEPLLALQPHITGAAHITGGGLVDNPPRALRPGTAIELETPTLPGVFQWLQEAGPIEPMELYKTFNCGMGMLVFAPPAQEGVVMDLLTGHGGWVTGTVVAGEAPLVRFV